MTRMKKKIGGDVRCAVFAIFFSCNSQGRPNVSVVKKWGKEEMLLTFLITSIGCIYYVK